MARGQRVHPRRHPIRRRKRFGFWWGMGKQVTDANSGIPIPERLAVRDEAGTYPVYYRKSEDCRDRADDA